MDQFFFWKSWSGKEKYFQFGLLGLFIITVITYLIARYLGTDWAIHWQTVSNLTVQKIEVDRLDLPLADLKIMADNFLINQFFEGSDLQLLTWPSYLFLIIFGLAFVVLLSIAPSLKRFSFLLSQIALIFLLVGFKLEQLLLFGSTDKWTLVAAFFIYLPTGYYFHSMKPDISFYKRVGVFTGCTALFALLIHFGSEVSHPFLYLMHYGMVVPVVLSVVFILMVSHEIVYAFLVVVTRGNTATSKNSLTHFTLFSVIYLVNVALLYLKITKRIDWDFYFLDAYWVLFFSAVIGIWGIRGRKELYQNIIAFRPYALWGYLALAIICFATIGYYFATANDALIETFEDVIVFGQLGFGVGFFLYTAFNFWRLLLENLPVYKVVFKPQKMPYFTINFAGLIAVVAFFGLSNRLAYYQAVSTYYNGIGDLHAIDNQDFLAKEYYKQGSIFESQNHRSNYALASMARQENDRADAIYYFKQSLQKKPTEYAYVNLANLYQQRGSFFDAFFILNEGLELFPNSGWINNNLGLVYGQTNIIDSAAYFLAHAAENRNTAKQARSNMVALVAGSKEKWDFDSLQDTFGSDQYLPTWSNLLVMANAQGNQQEVALTLPPDSTFNPESFALWYNYGFQSTETSDSSYSQSLEVLINRVENQDYGELLTLALAFNLYQANQVGLAFERVEQLIYQNQNNAGYYFDLLGLWALQQHSPYLAIDYFNDALEAGSRNAGWHLAVALAEAGLKDQALAQCARVIRLGQGEQQILAGQLLSVLNIDSLRQVSDLDLVAQKAFFYYQSVDLEDVQTQYLLQSIDQPDHAEILYSEFEKSIKRGDSLTAKKLMKVIDAYDNFPKPVHLELLAFANDYKALADEIDSWQPESMAEQDHKKYFQALIYMEQDKPEQALSLVENIVGRNPFQEEVVLTAARFYREQLQEDLKAYEILLKALDVNRYSIPILKAYTLQCLRLNLDTYAEDGRSRLSDLLTPDAALAFKDQYALLAKKMEEIGEEWNP